MYVYICVCMGLNPQTKLPPPFLTHFSWMEENKEEEEEEANRALRTHPSSPFISPSPRRLDSALQRSSSDLFKTYIYLLTLNSQQLIFLFSTFYLICVIEREKKVSSAFSAFKVTFACSVLHQKRNHFDACNVWLVRRCFYRELLFSSPSPSSPAVCLYHCLWMSLPQFIK